MREGSVLGEVQARSIHNCMNFCSSVNSSARKMATDAEGAITTQPRSKRKEIETFVRDLDPLQVQGLYID